MSRPCPFCDILDGKAPGRVVQDSPSGNFFVLEPIGPHVPGHLLVIPKEHVEAPSDLRMASAMREAACVAGELGIDSYNLLLSYGAQATQTVAHLHVHLLPRSEHDGTPSDWPWMRPHR